jgi:predicted acyltransferase (DUF342 family)
MPEQVKYGVLEVNKFLEASALNEYIYKQIRTSVWNVKYLNSGTIAIGHSGVMWEDTGHGTDDNPRKYVLDVNGSSYFHQYCKINSNLDVIKNLNVFGVFNFSNMSGSLMNATESTIKNLTCENIDIDNNLTNYGITTLNNNTNISGNTTILGNLNVSQNINLDGSLNVKSNTNISGNSIIYGTLNVLNNTNISGNTIITGNLNVSNNTNISGNTIISGNLNVNRNLNISANTNIYGVLDVSNNTIIRGNTDIYGNLNVSRNANISGDITTHGNINVSKDVNILGILMPKKIRMNSNIDYRSSTQDTADITIGRGSIMYLDKLYVEDIQVLRDFTSNTELKVNVPKEANSSTFTGINVHNIITETFVDNVSVFNIVTRSKMELGAAYNLIQATQLEANTYGGFMHGIYNASSTVTTTYFDISANSNSDKGGKGIIYQGPVEFYTDNLLIDGNLKITGDIYSYSDKNIKDNIIKLDNCLNKISDIHGYYFTRKDLINMSQIHIGLLAQEVESIFPEIVQEKNNIKSINYQSIVAILIESIKDLQNDCTKLKNEFLELKNNLLQNKIL